MAKTATQFRGINGVNERVIAYEMYITLWEAKSVGKYTPFWVGRVA